MYFRPVNFYSIIIEMKFKRKLSIFFFSLNKVQNTNTINKSFRINDNSPKRLSPRRNEHIISITKITNTAFFFVVLFCLYGLQYPLLFLTYIFYFYTKLQNSSRKSTIYEWDIRLNLKIISEFSPTFPHIN